MESSWFAYNIVSESNQVYFCSQGKKLMSELKKITKCSPKISQAETDGFVRKLPGMSYLQDEYQHQSNFDSICQRNSI